MAGTMLAIVGAIVAVQRAHRLQLVADRAREMRQLASEMESLEMLLGDVLVTLKRVEAESIDAAAFVVYLAEPSRESALSVVQEALELCKRSNAIRPHALVNYVWAHNAAQSVIAAVRQTRTGHGSSSDINFDWIRAAVGPAIEQIEAIIAGLRGDREIYTLMAEGKKPFD